MTTKYACIVLTESLKLYVPLELAAPTYAWKWNEDHQYVECQKTQIKLNDVVGSPKSWNSERMFFGDISHPEM